VYNFDTTRVKDTIIWKLDTGGKVLLDIILNFRGPHKERADFIENIKPADETVKDIEYFVYKAIKASYSQNDKSEARKNLYKSLEPIIKTDFIFSSHNSAHGLNIFTKIHSARIDKYESLTKLLTEKIIENTFDKPLPPRVHTAEEEAKLIEYHKFKEKEKNNPLPEAQISHPAHEIYSENVDHYMMLSYSERHPESQLAALNKEEWELPLSHHIKTPEIIAESSMHEFNNQKSYKKKGLEERLAEIKESHLNKNIKNILKKRAKAAANYIKTNGNDISF
jgi:hypothetical protein